MKVKISQVVVEYLAEENIELAVNNILLKWLVKDMQNHNSEWSDSKERPDGPPWNSPEDENEEEHEHRRGKPVEQQPEEPKPAWWDEMHLIRPMFNGLTFTELSKPTNYNKVDTPMACFVCSRLPEGQGRNMTILKRGYYFSSKSDKSGRKLNAPLCPKHNGCDHQVQAEREGEV